MVFQIGNFYYYLSIVVMLILPIALYLLIRNKSQKTIKITLIAIAIFNFLLHFLKILHPSYLVDIKDSLVRMTPENICALSTIVLPFVMLMKKTALKGYLYLISFLGGLMAVIIIPQYMNGMKIYEFELVRYWTCHYILFMVPVVACLTKEYKPNYKHAIYMPLFFLAGQTIILLNELFILKVGLIKYGTKEFFSPVIRNMSFVFGPNGSGGKLVDAFMFLVPKVFTKNVFGIEGVGDFYWPVVWLLFPTIIFFPIGYLVLTLPFTYKDIKNDIKRYIK